MANTPGYNANAVSEQTIALLLNLVRYVPQYSVEMKNGQWLRHLSIELAGKRLGILGFGAIGQKSAAKMSGWDVDIVAYDKYPNMEAAKKLNVQMCDFEKVIGTSDFLLIHLPLLPETEKIINAENIAKMKDGVFIVNTGRGPLVNEEDAAAAMKSGKIGGMASDVFVTEPLTENPYVIMLEFHLFPAHLPEKPTRICRQPAQLRRRR